MIQTVILAGGRGTRLGDETADTPKCMVDVNGRPFLRYLLDDLFRNRITQVVILAGHLGGQIEKEIGNGSEYGMDVTYHYDGAVSLGTGGAVKQALPHLDREFLVINGDGINPPWFVFFPYLVSYWRRHRTLGGLMTVFSGDPVNVDYHWASGKIRGYGEALSPWTYRDYGATIFHASAFQDCCPATRAFHLGEVYRSMALRGALGGFEVECAIQEIGTVKGLAHFRRAQEESCKTSVII